MKLIFIAAIIGSVLGFIGSRILFVGSALSLIPWAIVGLVIGWFSKGMKDAIRNGGLYGFFLAFIFMLAGYTGNSPIITRFPFFALLGLVGAFCGAILSLVANIISNRVKKTE